MGGSGSSCFLSFKVLLGGIATLSFVLLLLVGALESGATSETTTSRLASAQATQINDLKDEHEKEVIGREKLVYNSELDLNYMMSKRRVPNGPDPIHNRRTGNSKRPPGRA
ncbi:CLAVATA3/ESR (CLE)-RELATED PROTEIN 26 [Salix viminalis]|uniref:CLAVATA3/ESR (CLE)-RELATED PROTEIN 26 n=1 Tax=Salix viminalis TaxID=40686 RepID=A0A9Q0U1S8_SALVM|nr:CLAVATA3/ESR (CLE)-RELATED PROTEIN 26 [Salix viminalis]